MSKKDEFVNKIKAQIDEWGAEIGKLEAKIKKAKPDVKTKQKEQLSLLHKEYDKAKQKLSEVQHTSEDAWDEIKEGIEASWKRIKSALEKALSKLK